MSMTCRRVLALVGLVVGLSSLAAMALPGFSDQNVSAGNLNPTDTIKVQEIRITRGASEVVTLSSITVQNLGTAGDGDIDKITVEDGGDVLGETTAISGLASGITINLGGFNMTSTTHVLKIYVTVGTAVSGGETINLRVRVHYVSNSASYTSAWISDLAGETIRDGGFDVIEDSSPDAGYFNPSDTGIVQTSVFSDTDANGSPILWHTANPLVKVENLGTATNTDIATVTVIIRKGASEWTRTDPWPAGTAGRTFDASSFVPTAPEVVLLTLGGQAVADNGSLTVIVRMAFAAQASMTDGRTVHTKVTLFVDERGESAAGVAGQLVAYQQSVAAETTQTLRKQGFERIVEESASLASGTAATGDPIVQTIHCYDRDANGFGVAAWRIYIRNTGTAEGTEIDTIVVKAGNTTLLTINNDAPLHPAHDQLPNFKTGQWYTFAAPFVVDDDHDQVFRVSYTIGAPVDGHTLRPSVRIEGREQATPLPATPWTEGMNDYPSDEVTYPNPLVLHLPGLEFVENQTPPEGGAAYSGQRLLAQTIRVEDLDEDDDNVTINPIVVKNIGSATSTDVTKVEVWRRNTPTATPVKLGETTALSGLRTGGARIELTHDNVVTDAAGGAEAYLDVYLTMAEPEVMTATRTIQLETRVLHTENLQSFDKMAVSNQWTLETNHRPVADFTFALATTPASVQAKADFTYQQTIQFTGTATDADGDAITKWAWTFGDAATSNVQNPTHRYPNGGTFTVTLTVTDARGVSGSKSKTLTIQGPPNVVPTVTFTWTPVAPASITTEVTFTSTVTDSDQPAGTAFTYAWNFGDTATSALANPKHTFAEKKSYTVKLTVTDARSAAVTVEHTISVGNTLPVVATLTASNVSPNTGDVVTFTATATDADSDPIAKLTWDFGDGTAVQTTTTGTTTHTYAAPGTCTVLVTATDSRGAVSVAKTLSITVAGPDRILLIIYPNPAKTQATVRCSLPSGVTEPVLVVYSLGGDIVLRQELTAGQVYVWNLLDAAGDRAGNGLYFGVVTATAAGGGSVRSEVFRLLIVR